MTDPIPYERLTLEVIQRAFDPRTCQRARRYVELIRELSLTSEGRLSARVQGSEPEPYELQIAIADHSRGARPNIDVEAACSCPVGYRCKHAAAVLMALAAGRRPSPVSPFVLRWADEVRSMAGLGREESEARTGSGEAAEGTALHYLLQPGEIAGRLGLSIHKGRLEPDRRGPRGLTRWRNFRRALVDPPSFLRQEDLPVLRELHRRGDGLAQWEEQIEIGLREDAALLQRLAATGRLYYAPAPAPGQPEQWLPLRPGAPRKLTVAWQREGAAERVRLISRLEPQADWTCASVPPSYVDLQRGELGTAVGEAPPEVLARLLELPPLNAVESAVVAEALREAAPQLPRPQLSGESLTTVGGPPVPVLEPLTLKVWQLRQHRGYPAGYSGEFDVARVRFRYGAHEVEAFDETTLLVAGDGRAVRIERDGAGEARRLAELGALGLQRLAPGTVQGRRVPGALFGLASEQAWQRFAEQVARPLRAQGWRVRGERDFRHFGYLVEDWSLEVTEAAEGQYAVALGIEVDGRPVDLVPLLQQLFRADPRWTDLRELDRIAEQSTVALAAPGGERILMPAARIKPIARTLAELFDKPPADGRLQLSRYDAPRLVELAPDTRGLEAVQRFAASLPGACRPEPVPCPGGFRGALRPYQLEGLAWLQHLARHDLAGILADDMGLGKTAQTLAHLLLEKESGRLDRPCLAVVPTSLVYNWQREAERFAPALRVLSLHGPRRHAAREAIPGADLCLTTYSLLWRDEPALRAHPWHLLILDEAQSVKNIASRGAQVLRNLQARHRLCLTGTPLENHLGELWTQFDFLLPGFLGDSRTFNRLWRTPVEKHGDALRAGLLARRVRPFVLRRSKETVARELPPKTIAVRSVELEGGQRDLYETVRAAMDRKVREAVTAQGLARSRIVILEALLKLRQVCCDPRLLGKASAERVKERAKLDLLMAMLGPLVDEGRRVLVFSQFTGMLDLIERELAAESLAWVRLDGGTVDRQRPVDRFQRGEVPLFLVSLKAGGVGLNLTAADTVIHYDPWWNPAVEAQATDRAHRIGQDKPVFVYKLIVAGSIEERILALQERKAELAACILEEGGSGRLDLDEATLAELLAPLEG